MENQKFIIKGTKQGCLRIWICREAKQFKNSYTIFEREAISGSKLEMEKLLQKLLTQHGFKNKKLQIVAV